jgi:hypothetical protein
MWWIEEKLEINSSILWKIQMKNKREDCRRMGREKPCSKAG